MKTACKPLRWMTLGMAWCVASAIYADEPPKSLSIRKQDLALQTQQSTMQDSQGLRRSYRVVVEGTGNIDEIDEVKSDIQKQLESSGFAGEIKTAALDAIMLKLEEVTQKAPEWSGRIVWNSTVPGSSETAFEDFKVVEETPAVRNENGDIASSNRSPDRLRNTANRARQAAERLADRAAHMQKSLGNAQPSYNFVAPKYRIGIDCRLVLEKSNQFSEPPADEKNPEIRKPVFEIESVLKDSPAEQAGLQPGDQVQLIDGNAMVSIEQLVDAVQQAGQKSEKIVIEVSRENNHLEFEIEPVVIAELNFQNMDQPLPFPMFGNGFPNMVPNNFQGFPGQFGPGWVMNREEMSQLQNLAEQASRNANAANENARLLDKSDVPALRDEVSSLRKEISEIKEMLKAIVEKN